MMTRSSHYNCSSFFQWKVPTVVALVAVVAVVAVIAVVVAGFGSLLL